MKHGVVAQLVIGGSRGHYVLRNRFFPPVSHSDYWQITLPIGACQSFSSRCLYDWGNFLSSLFGFTWAAYSLQSRTLYVTGNILISSDLVDEKWGEQTEVVPLCVSSRLSYARFHKIQVKTSFKFCIVLSRYKSRVNMKSSFIELNNY